MKPKSKHGVYHDITQSEYHIEILDIKFVFSSQFYLSKFTDSYSEEIVRFNESISRVYKDQFNLNFDVLALIRHYMQIEKRDFLLVVKGVEARCPDDLLFLASVDNVNSRNSYANLTSESETRNTI